MKNICLQGYILYPSSQFGWASVLFLAPGGREEDSGSIGERKLSMGRMSDEARRCRNEKNKERMHKSFPKWENNLKIGREFAMGKSGIINPAMPLTTATT